MKPQFFQGAAILFWGLQTELLYFAIPMAIILEARYFINRRWALTKTDFYRVSDLTSLGLLAMVVFLSMNAREYHFLTHLLAWLPILFFPLVAVLGYSTTERMPLDVMFYSLRRQREPVQQAWDMDYVLMAACLLGAGFNKDHALFLPVALIIIMGSFYRVRSKRFDKSVFVLACTLVVVFALSTQYGLRGAHLGIKKKTEEWIAEWVRSRNDPYRSRTAIGYVGKLKLSDTIDFRIEPLSGKQDFPTLLGEAAYDHPDNGEWMVFTQKSHLVEHADDFRWNFVDRDPRQDPQAKIYIEFEKESDLVPVPAELTEVNELPAQQIRLSPYGTLKAEELIPSPHYLVRYSMERTLADDPTEADLFVPDSLKTNFSEMFPQQVGEAVPYVAGFFNDFSYSLYQEKNTSGDEPLVNFLTTTKSGHCEYFASATVLMLRHLGVPARYVVGYSIQEWNEDLKMYIVRKRHAHAWATAWVDGHWVVVDTTPSNWLDMENAASFPLQPIFDFLSNNQFRFQLWWNDQRLEDYETELYILGFILLLVLIWRIATSESVMLEDDTVAIRQRRTNPGDESPFYNIENLLTEQGYRRSAGELMTHWLLRIEKPELLPLLSIHNRWRFDPHGLSMEDKQRLANQVSDWLQENVVDDDQLGRGSTA